MIRIVPLAVCLLVAAPLAEAAAQGVRETPAPKAQPKKQRSPQEILSILLDRLPKANETEAKLIERQLAGLWTRTGSDTADLLLSRSTAAMTKGDADLALDLLSRLVTLFPQTPEAWNRRAFLYFQKKDYGRSVADLSEVLIREPRHFVALAALGAILEQIGEKRKALDAYRRVLAIHPFHEEAAKAAKRLAQELERDI